MESNQPQLCVAICETSLGALLEAGKRAAEFGDLVELRLDCLSEDDFGSEQVENLLREFSVPAIITYRPAEQGGSSDA
ncbi:MAG TPA: type I 3-dehydroquinate dehydratase, partial [Pyrinomonadaceae bacterium]|nr:type I 3-dehydroquinate dehydratase [Pyrinomonadaceae bacterium]